MDQQIKGSQYIAYRNDEGADGKYLPTSEVTTLPIDRENWYNPSNKPDPLAEFDMLSEPERGSSPS